jgi:putative tryptophan/tyrosine transport system substrate-binding protein
MDTAALMWVPTNPQQVLLQAQTERAGEILGIQLVSLPLKAADDITPALKIAHSRHASALVVAADPLTVSNRRTIIEGCRALNMPAMHTYAFEAREGAFMSYGIDLLENYGRAAEYADRILRGTKIADLPFQEPTRLTFVINLRSARSMRVNVPNTLLALADEVIE